MSKLITPSLIGSVKWFETCYSPKWKEKAYKDLNNMLSRVYTQPGIAAKRGIDFENYIYNILNSPKKERLDELSCSNEFLRVLRLCKGGEFQRKSKSFIKVDGIEYCLYGKLDVWFPELIIDIKTTKSFRKSKYIDSMQHVIYIYNETIGHFKYVIAVFKEENGTKIEDIKEIDVCLTKDYCEDLIIKEIKKVEKFMKDYPEFNKLWEEKYSLY